MGKSKEVFGIVTQEGTALIKVPVYGGPNRGVSSHGSEFLRFDSALLDDLAEHLKAQRKGYDTVPAGRRARARRHRLVG